MASDKTNPGANAAAKFKQDIPFKDYKKILDKQGYRFIGEHSAVKVCEWTKKSLRHQGVCYKQKFYGIQSHQCCQMSVSVNFCNMDCVFCWRDRNNTTYEKVDDPATLVAKAQEAQRKLLAGFGGFEGTDKKKYKDAQLPVHFAVSLTGETLSYPKLDLFLNEIEKQGCTSFVVTNGMFPKVMEKMHPPTQLYLSLSAPTEELFLKIDRPMDWKNGWKTLMKSFDALSRVKGKTRTVIRCTVIKGLNDVFPDKWAELIMKGNPDFVEVKSYMWLGASQNRLKKSHMVAFKELKDFAQRICDETAKLSGSKAAAYSIIDDQEVSAVVLLGKKDSCDRLIDFSKLGKTKK